VLLIFAEADREAALGAAHALRTEGLSVQALGTDRGQPGRVKLLQELNRANCVVTLWSSSARADQALIEWSRAADQRKALVSASLDGAGAPDDFSTDAAKTAADWSQGAASDKTKRLLHAVRDQVDKAPSLTREEFLASFFSFGGLRFGLTLDDVVAR